MVIMVRAYGKASLRFEGAITLSVMCNSDAQVFYEIEWMLIGLGMFSKVVSVDYQVL